MKRLLCILALNLLSLTLIPVFAAKQEILRLELEEISNEPGLVSTNSKQFRLLIEHDPNFIPTISDQDDNRLSSSNGVTSSVILDNLDVIKRDLNRNKKNPKSIRDDFKFNLENGGSFASDNTEGWLKTKFVSNGLVFKKAQRLNFKIELQDYLDARQINTSKLQTKVNQKHDINSLAIEFNNLTVNLDTLTWQAIKSKKKESKITAGTIKVIGLVNSSENITNVVKKKQFRTTSDEGEKINPKIKKDGQKVGTKYKLKTKVDNDDIEVTSLGSGEYQISIPIELTSKAKLIQAERENLKNLDLLIIPVVLDLKTGSNLDININGTLRQKLNMQYSGEEENESEE